MVRRGQGASREWTFLRPREQIEQREVATRGPQGTVRQMFWAAFGYDERSSLIALDGNVDSDGIYELYSTILPDFIQATDIFMHDNALVYIASVIKQLLAKIGIKTMVWPPYSLDLNPIENLWSLIKREIYRRFLEL